MPIDLIFVGGFLGAGKTTLLHAAARTLAARGRRVGLVTNDQAPLLFDSRVLADAGPIAEVAGACLCCSFDDLITAIEHLAAQGVDTILAEPVGSCTDLSATLLQPLKALHRDRVRLAPLTVLADPDRLLDALDARASQLHDATAYIYLLQLQEADRILVTKADAIAPAEVAAIVDIARSSFNGVPVDAIASATGDGVDRWVDAVLAGGPVGQRVLEVDYDRYAEGEAVLAWLNATVSADVDADAPLRVVEAIRRASAALPAEIGHVKVVLTGPGLHARAQCVATRGPVTTDRAGVGRGTELIVNARVQCTPEALETIVREALAPVGRVDALDCFSPAYPRPTHRYAGVV